MSDIRKKQTRLYVPVGVKVREFEAKVLLSCAAAEAGYDVVLGGRRAMKRQLGRLPKGIYLFGGNVFGSKAWKFFHYKKLGYPVVAYDEEGLIFFSPEMYQKMRVSSETLKQVEYFLAWGSRQKAIVDEKAPGDGNTVIPVGNPRVDLTRKELRDFYAPEVEKLHARYGKFLLINTNFSLYNNRRVGRDATNAAVIKQLFKVVDDDYLEFYLRLREHQQLLFDEFSTMVLKIRQAFPEVSIVLRPHPSEDHGYWRDLLADDDKTHIVHEGNVLPWLMAAEALIHNNCTTGVEAYLLDRPVMCYKPVDAPEFDFHLPNALSEQIFSLEDLTDQLARCFQNGGRPQDVADDNKREIAKSYITGLDGPLACDRIIETLNQVQTLPGAASIFWYRSSRKLGRVRGKIRRILQPQKAAAPAERLKLPVKDNRPVFPGIAVEEVRQVITQLQRVTGRFAGIHTSPLGEDLIRISSATESFRG